MSDSRDRLLILETLEALLDTQLRSVRRLMGRSPDRPGGARRRRRQRRSLVDLAIELLTAEGRPLHVDELVRRLAERHDRHTDRDSLASALSKRALQGGEVLRTGPAIFAVPKR
jgi:hypothetical protein